MIIAKKKYNVVYVKDSTQPSKHKPSLLKLCISLVLASAFLVYPLTRPWYDYRPDFMLIVALYWSLQYPRHYQYGFVFSVGIISDVFQGHLLGVHAFIYVVALYIANNIVDFDPKRYKTTQLKTLLMAWTIAVLLLCVVFALLGVINPWQPLLTYVPGVAVLMFSSVVLAAR